MRQEGTVGRKNWDNGSLEWVEGFGELQMCARTAVRLKALRQAGSGNPTVKLGPCMFVHVSPLDYKVKQKMCELLISQFAWSSLVSMAHSSAQLIKPADCQHSLQSVGALCAISISFPLGWACLCQE